jgi:hypothetical protein
MDSKQMIKAILVIVIGSVAASLATKYVNDKLKSDCGCTKTS